MKTPKKTSAREVPGEPDPEAERISTTIRIEPKQLERLKIVAARKRCRVNDLLLEGAEYVLAKYE